MTLTGRQIVRAVAHPRALAAWLKARMKGEPAVFARPLPKHLKQNQRKFGAEGEAQLRAHPHLGPGAAAQAAAGTPGDEEQDAAYRLAHDRARVVPWLDAAHPLDDMRILEVGCGKGSSTVALAEQGARVVALDIDEESLAVAQARCQAYGVAAELLCLNAGRMRDALRDRSFDAVIFFASLEHMILQERLAALRDAWEMLPTGGLLVVVETPNRLWYEDGHTAGLPFYHWLPNELAFHYARMSRRDGFSDRYTVYDAASKEHFLRRGRGVSFHELDLAIGPAAELDVVSSLRSFDPGSVPVSRLGLRHQRLLKALRPDLHPGFFEEYLDIIIRKR